MFSFLVRNEYGQWKPTAHCVVERENSEVLSTAPAQIKLWCAGRWKPRYFSTDNSSIKQKTVRLVFPGLLAGEQEVSHLLCTVHSERTLLRRMGSTDCETARALMRRALHAFTEPQCEAICMEAINAAPGKIKKYLRTEWLPNLAR